MGKGVNLFSLLASLKPASTPLCIIFRYFDRKGIKNLWVLTHVKIHTRSSAGNKKNRLGKENRVYLVVF